MRLVIVTQSINHFNQVGHIVPCCFKTVFMNNLLFILAVVLIIGWLLGFFVFHASGLIHVLIIIALIAIIIRVIRGKRAI